jgi:hypothetical protein
MAMFFSTIVAKRARVMPRVASGAWASTSTPLSMATRVPSKFDGCANTSLPFMWLVITAAVAIGSGMGSTCPCAIHDPVNSFVTSAPAFRFSRTSCRASSGVFGVCISHFTQVGIVSRT